MTSSHPNLKKGIQLAPHLVSIRNTIESVLSQELMEGSSCHSVSLQTGSSPLQAPPAGPSCLQVLPGISARSLQGNPPSDLLQVLRCLQETRVQ